MVQTNTILQRYPLIISFVTVLFTIISITLFASIFSNVLSLPNEMSGALARILVTLLLLTIAIKAHITPCNIFFGHNTRLNKRWLAALPMIAIASLNWFFVQWDQLVPSLSSTFSWLLAGLASGFFEEGMMRAVVFFILWRAWQHRAHGLLLAAVAQACFFGLLHLLNLGDIPTGALFAQIGYAVFLGFGFAALVTYTGSIWPAIATHVIINLNGTLNRFFIPNYAEQPEAIEVYVVLCSIIFLLAAVPGWFYIKKVSSSWLEK